jgi:hypothetical protein
MSGAEAWAEQPPTHPRGRQVVGDGPPHLGVRLPNRPQMMPAAAGAARAYDCSRCCTHLQCGGSHRGARFGSAARRAGSVRPEVPPTPCGAGAVRASSVAWEGAGEARVGARPGCPPGSAPVRHHAHGGSCAPPAGLEPATNGLEVRRSIQLSYEGGEIGVRIRWTDLTSVMASGQPPSDPSVSMPHRAAPRVEAVRRRPEGREALTGLPGPSWAGRPPRKTAGRARRRGGPGPAPGCCDSPR